MKILYFVLTLFAFYSCRMTVPKGIKKMVTGFDAKEFKFKRVHEYGGGDCWGKIYEYSSGKEIIGIDSMECGEYSFYRRKILISDNQIQKAHIQKSKTRMETLDDPDERYILLEMFLDQNHLTKNIQRKDTVKEPQFDLITNQWVPLTTDRDSITNTLLLEYHNTWKRKAEY